MQRNATFVLVHQDEIPVVSHSYYRRPRRRWTALGIHVARFGLINREEYGLENNKAGDKTQIGTRDGFPGLAIVTLDLHPQSLSTGYLPRGCRIDLTIG